MTVRAWVFGLLIGLAVLPTFGTAEPIAPKKSFNVGLSPRLFPHLKKSDVVASLQIWADYILDSMDMDLTSECWLCEDVSELTAGLLADELDMVTLMTSEFFMIEDLLQEDRVLFYSKHGKLTTEYLLLTDRMSPMNDLASLKGKTIAVAQDASFGAGKIWIDTLLMEQGERTLAEYCEMLPIAPKASRAVLSVFFGKADACLVTRSGFELMVELNPQVGKKLQVSIASPEFVPAISCLRKTFTGPLCDEIVKAAIESKPDPKGQQVFALFGIAGMKEGTSEKLATTREWYDRYMLLKQNLDLTMAEETE